ncbi:MAG: hypothetical protein RQ966_06260 [Acetobacteraceae bacterium]|nr:hypothetical protein [Acetobacteraceae bacterium]
MPVVINQFEAVAEPPAPPSAAPALPAPPPKIEPQALLAPLRRIARRHERLKAH